jgi:acyl-CoA dehydrogenase family member 9
MTEQSVVRSIFQGSIDESLVFPFPRVGPEEQRNTTAVVDTVRTFLDKRVSAAKTDNDQAIDAAVMHGMKALGLFGMIIPEAYGGIGLGARSYARVMQQIAACDASLAVTLGAHQSIGLKGILLFGTEAQKKAYLPRLATGESVAAFALTETGAGSDAAAIRTRAEPLSGGDFVLNGSKVWITNGGIADVFTVFAKMPSAGDRPKLTAFIVERGMGVTTGPSDHKLGIRGSSTTEVWLDDVRVPAGNVLGEVGRGFKVAMEVLNSGRLSLAAGCVGASKRLVDLAVGRALERTTFGRAIADYGLIKDKIAEMMAGTFAIESMTYLTAGLLDTVGGSWPLECAACKVYGSETRWRTVNDALQIAGGSGYMQDHPYERMLRDSRINMIYEGTNEVLRAYVGLVGLQMPAAVAGRHSRVTKAHPVLAREARVLERFAAELRDRIDETVQWCGRDIADKQHAQGRVADMAMDLFAIGACLSRTTSALQARGESEACREVELCQSVVASAERRLDRTARSFADNDDERRDAVASRACADGGYPLDVFWGL